VLRGARASHAWKTTLRIQNARGMTETPFRY